jgi:hypothetical protein
MAGGLVPPGSAFNIAFQQGFLARSFEEGLDSESAFSHDVVVEMIPIRAGNSITKTKIGRTPPQPTPLNPVNVTGLDNGLTATTPSLEQYTYNVNQYAGNKQLDLLEEQEGIADQLMALAHTNGVEAAQTIERVLKQTWFAAYNTGNTWIRNAAMGETDPTTAKIYVDDIRGFQVNWVNGVPTPVAVDNPLPVQEVAFNGGVTQTFNVVAAVADVPTNSVYPASVVGSASDGISGYLTINPVAGTLPVGGDALQSSLGSPVYRPNNKQGTNQLTSQDLLSISLLQTAQASLSQNAIPRHRDGTYHCYLDYHSMTELLIDSQFQIMYASRGNNPEYQNNQVFTLLGMTFIPTTEVYLQASVAAAGMQALLPGTSIHRVLITGMGGLYQGHFSGLESFAQRGEAVGSVSNIYMVDHIAHIVRAPIDNMGRQVQMTYLSVFGVVCPTDLTANPSIIPTASNAAYKRAVVIEHC